MKKSPYSYGDFCSNIFILAFTVFSITIAFNYFCLFDPLSIFPVQLIFGYFFTCLIFSIIVIFFNFAPKNIRHLKSFNYVTINWDMEKFIIIFQHVF